MAIKNVPTPTNNGSQYADNLVNQGNVVDCIYYMSCTRSPTKCNKDCNKYKPLKPEK